MKNMKDKYVKKRTTMDYKAWVKWLADADAEQFDVDSIANILDIPRSLVVYFLTH